MPLLERIYAWILRRIFKYNYDTQVLTAFAYPFSLAFEWYAWRQLKKRIFAGELDVVLRVLPMSPSLASPFAFFLRKGPIPFVLGPLNGGLPWPPGFGQLETKRNGSPICRNLYRYLPFAQLHLSLRDSDHCRFVPDVCSEFAKYQRQSVFCPGARHR